MNAKIITKSLVLFLCIFTLHRQEANAQGFYQQFKALTKEDSTARWELLQKWEATDKNDPDLYIAYFNYYVNQSKSDRIAIGNELPAGYNDQAMSFSDTATGETAGFIYGDVYYDSSLVQKGFDYITKGIEKFPDRLDMRFGKVYMYGEVKEYELFTQEIIKAVDYSVQIKNQWKWTDGKPLDDGKDFMLKTIQNYQLQIYDVGDDSLLVNMKKIAEAVLKHYPDHVESLSNLSVYYTINKDYNSAIEQLLKAEKIAPKDFIVLGNLAHAYKLTGDKKNAKKYYELMLKYGDEDAKDYATEMLKELE